MKGAKENFSEIIKNNLFKGKVKFINIELNDSSTFRF